MERLLCIALAALLAWTLGASAADPTRIEQLSSPQSQTIGKKFCTGGPQGGVWVPNADPCPGTGSSSGGSPAPAGDARANMMNEAERYERQQRDNQRLRMESAEQAGIAFKQGERYLAGDGVPRDVGRAFYLFRAACSFSDNHYGCGNAGEVLLKFPVEGRSQMERDIRSSALIAFDIAGNGCWRGDRSACFVQRRASIEAGIKPPFPELTPLEMIAFNRALDDEQEAVAEQARARARAAEARAQERAETERLRVEYANQSPAARTIQEGWFKNGMKDEYLYEALRLDPDYRPALTFLAMVHLRNNEPAKAVPLLQRME